MQRQEKRVTSQNSFYFDLNSEKHVEIAIIDEFRQDLKNNDGDLGK